jgi:IS5 family transposase
VLQRAESLTDRGAAEAVRARLDWKYLLGLGLDDPGFDHSVLAEFRDRVAAHGLEEAVLDTAGPAGRRGPGQGGWEAAH